MFEFLLWIECDTRLFIKITKYFHTVDIQLFCINRFTNYIIRNKGTVLYLSITEKHSESVWVIPKVFIHGCV